VTQSQDNKQLSIRAHHLLCLHGFRGLGYDEEFVRNMAAIHRRLCEEKDLKIKVVDTADDICESCPHILPDCCGRELPSGRSLSEELDHRVLAHLGIEAGQVFDKEEILSLVIEKIAPEDVAVICRGCEWQPFEYCSEGLRKQVLEKERRAEEKETG